MHRKEDLPQGLMPNVAECRRRAVEFFTALRDRICTCIEEFEAGAARSGKIPPRFERTDWQRPEMVGDDGGGGTMSILRGNVFEKIGVNISEVKGTFSSEFAKEIPGVGTDDAFWAAGISLVAHPLSPKVPAVHMNVRHIMTGCWWFGGGADLTPVVPVRDDTDAFHDSLRAVCDAHEPGLYLEYRQWCDDYFFLPHRKEARGVGGIFFDYRNSGDWESDFAFTKAVGSAFLDVYPPIVHRRMAEPWSDEDRERQLRKRARYAEFNLAFDRGTRFGLMTGGNPEAVLMSLPPLAAWP